MNKIFDAILAAIEAKQGALANFTVDYDEGLTVEIKFVFSPSRFGQAVLLALAEWARPAEKTAPARAPYVVGYRDPDTGKVETLDPSTGAGQ